MLLPAAKILKPYLRRIWISRAVVFWRNKLNIRPEYFIYPSISNSYSASDMFVWRTDKGLKTVFRVSDIPHIYFDVESNLLLNFFDEHGAAIREEVLPLNGQLAEFEITKEFVGKEGIGTFSAYHIPTKEIDDQLSITNRCYVGYSVGKAIPSFVHGNIVSRMILFAGAQKGSIQSALQQHRVSSEYHIQKQLHKFDRSELVFVNPLDGRPSWQ